MSSYLLRINNETKRNNNNNNGTKYTCILSDTERTNREMNEKQINSKDEEEGGNKQIQVLQAKYLQDSPIK